MNVLDQYKDLSVEKIKEEIQNNTIPAAIAMMHISGDFNLSTVIRNANFFGFREVFYIGGSRKWDRRGSVGTHHYTNLTFCPTFEDFKEKIKGKYNDIVAVENNVNFPTYVCNYSAFYDLKNPIFLFGEEQKGISEDILEQCKRIITIPCYGSVRSLNVGTASGIIMQNYRLTVNA